ncbi:MAG: hypothetical protein DRQ78_10755 [Epsilonproteobacteria bacterium]|nr:MAG: hypothetical protein DRQ78_10755 [Campylobacterota bacterium]
MKNKICITCDESKALVEYNMANHYKNGINNECKACNKIRTNEYAKSKKGITSTIYRTQKRNSKQRGHLFPTYTKEELREWLFAQPKFHILYDNWKRLDYQKEYKPSVDRKDDYIGYTMANIQLMTFRENCEKSYLDRIEGRNNKINQEVHQYTISNMFVASYHSQTEAERVTGISQANISAVCLGKRKKAGGYKWSYKIT